MKTINIIIILISSLNLQSQIIIKFVPSICLGQGVLGSAISKTNAPNSSISVNDRFSITDFIENPQSNYELQIIIKNNYLLSINRGSVKSEVKVNSYFLGNKLLGNNSSSLLRAYTMKTGKRCFVNRRLTIIPIIGLSLLKNNITNYNNPIIYLTPSDSSYFNWNQLSSNSIMYNLEVQTQFSNKNGKERILIGLGLDISDKKTFSNYGFQSTQNGTFKNEFKAFASGSQVKLRIGYPINLTNFYKQIKSKKEL
jgi:hypothetical protein